MLKSCVSLSSKLLKWINFLTLFVNDGKMKKSTCTLYETDKERNLIPWLPILKKEKGG